MKTCAIVVTFNRKDLLRSCLRALIGQTRSLDEIILVDNASTDGTEEMIKNEFPNVTYIKLSENMGGAGGFYEGIKTAYERGYDWTWIMDDDSEPKLDALEQLMNASNKIKGKIAALACFKINEKGEPLFIHMRKIDFDNFLVNNIDLSAKELYAHLRNYEARQFIETNFSSFVGLLVHRDAVKKVGFPQGSLFLNHDDVDYSVRLSRFGKIFIITKSMITHKEIPAPYSFIKLYYSYRNIIYLAKKYQKGNKFKMWSFVVYRLVRIVLRIMVFEEDKLWKIRLILKAFFDGLTGHLGKKI